MSKKMHYRSKDDIIRDIKAKKQPEKEIITVKGRQIEMGTLYATAYYLRKALMITLVLLIITGFLILSIGILSDEVIPEIKSIGLTTILSIILLIGLNKNKRLLDLSNKFKKRG